MSDYICENFLVDSKEYTKSEEIWKKTCEEAIQDGCEWLSWLKTEFSNGKKYSDGNPIFSLISEKINRAIKIIQLDPAGFDQEFGFWIDRFGDDSFDDEEEVIVLVISCVLTVHNLERSQEIIKLWLNCRIETETLVTSLNQFDK